MIFAHELFWANRILELTGARGSLVAAAGSDLPKIPLWDGDTRAGSRKHFCGAV